MKPRKVVIVVETHIKGLVEVSYDGEGYHATVVPPVPEVETRIAITALKSEGEIDGESKNALCALSEHLVLTWVHDKSVQKFKEIGGEAVRLENPKDGLLQ